MRARAPRTHSSILRSASSVARGLTLAAVAWLASGCGGGMRPAVRADFPTGAPPAFLKCAQTGLDRPACWDAARQFAEAGDSEWTGQTLALLLPPPEEDGARALAELAVWGEDKPWLSRNASWSAEELTDLRVPEAEPKPEGVLLLDGLDRDGTDLAGDVPLTRVDVDTEGRNDRKSQILLGLFGASHRNFAVSWATDDDRVQSLAVTPLLTRITGLMAPLGPSAQHAFALGRADSLWSQGQPAAARAAFRRLAEDQKAPCGVRERAAYGWWLSALVHGQATELGEARRWFGEPFGTTPCDRWTAARVDTMRVAMELEAIGRGFVGTTAKPFSFECFELAAALDGATPTQASRVSALWADAATRGLIPSCPQHVPEMGWAELETQLRRNGRLDRSLLGADRELLDERGHPRRTRVPSLAGALEARSEQWHAGSTAERLLALSPGSERRWNADPEAARPICRVALRALDSTFHTDRTNGWQVRSAEVLARMAGLVPTCGATAADKVEKALATHEKGEAGRRRALERLAGAAWRLSSGQAPGGAAAIGALAKAADNVFGSGEATAELEAGPSAAQAHPAYALFNAIAAANLSSARDLDAALALFVDASSAPSAVEESAGPPDGWATWRPGARILGRLMALAHEVLVSGQASAETFSALDQTVALDLGPWLGALGLSETDTEVIRDSWRALRMGLDVAVGSEAGSLGARADQVASAGALDAVEVEALSPLGRTWACALRAAAWDAVAWTHRGGLEPWRVTEGLERAGTAWSCAADTAPPTYQALFAELDRAHVAVGKLLFGPVNLDESWAAAQAAWAPGAQAETQPATALPRSVSWRRALVARWRALAGADIDASGYAVAAAEAPDADPTVRAATAWLAASAGQWSTTARTLPLTGPVQSTPYQCRWGGQFGPVALHLEATFTAGDALSSGARGPQWALRIRPPGSSRATSRCAAKPPERQWAWELARTAAGVFAGAALDDDALIDSVLGSGWAATQYFSADSSRSATLTPALILNAADAAILARFRGHLLLAQQLDNSAAMAAVTQREAINAAAFSTAHSASPRRALAGFETLESVFDGWRTVSTAAQLPTLVAAARAASYRTELFPDWGPLLAGDVLRQALGAESARLRRQLLGKTITQQTRLLATEWETLTGPSRPPAELDSVLRGLLNSRRAAETALAGLRLVERYAPLGSLSEAESALAVAESSVQGAAWPALAASVHAARARLAAGAGRWSLASDKLQLALDAMRGGGASGTQNRLQLIRAFAMQRRYDEMLRPCEELVDDLGDAYGFGHKTVYALRALELALRLRAQQPTGDLVAALAAEQRAPTGDEALDQARSFIGRIESLATRRAAAGDPKSPAERAVALANGYLLYLYEGGPPIAPVTTR